MKNYCLDKDEEGRYIVAVYPNEKNGTLSIELANGRVFKKIVACEENLEKIAAIQEEQARKGIAEYKTFKSKETASIFKTAISGVGILTAGVGASFIPAIQDLSTQHPVTVFAGIGAIAVLGSIPAYAKLKKDHARVKELDKLRYREEHLDELNRFRQYPNSLVGLRSSVVSYIKGEDDPFGILGIDYYDFDDLETIVSNIQTEEAFGFTYTRR